LLCAIAAVILVAAIAVALRSLRSDRLPEGVSTEDYQNAERKFRELYRKKGDRLDVLSVAGELAVAEKVSKKKASLTSSALLAEAAELARLRRQSAELKALFTIKQQVADEATDVAFWNKQIALADKTTAEERAAVLSNKLPSDAPLRLTGAPSGGASAFATEPGARGGRDVPRIS